MFKNSKIFLPLAVLLSYSSLTESSSASQPVLYLNTDTNAVLDQDGNTLSDNEIQNFIGPVNNPKNNSFTDTISDALRYIRGLTVGNPLTPQEALNLSGIFISIDMIDACHSLLSAHRYENNTPVTPANVLSFLARITLDYSRNPFGNILTTIKNQLVSENNLGLTKAVVQFMVNQARSYLTNTINTMKTDALAQGQSIEDINSFTEKATTFLDITSRMITGESTFADRCYFKIIKAIANAGDWIRTKVFRKPSIRNELGNNIINYIFNDDKVQALRRSTEAAIAQATDYAAAAGETIFDGIKWTIKTAQDAQSCFTKTIETIGDVSSEIITNISQTAGDTYATVTQTITSGTEKVEHVLNIAANATTDAFNLAKTSAESALEVLKDSPTSALQALSSLQDGFIATKTVILSDFIRSSVVKVIGSAEEIKESIDTAIAFAIYKLIRESNDTNHILTMISAVMVWNPEVFNLLFPYEETPDSCYLTTDVTNMYDEMNDLFDDKVNDIVNKLESLSGDDSVKINAAIQVNKEDIAKSAFGAIGLSSFIDAKGNPKFDIDELAKDNITVSAAKSRLNILASSASRIDQRSIATLIALIDTAVANRPIQRSPEEQSKYDTLISQLNALTGVNNQQDLINWIDKLSYEDYSLVQDEIEVQIFKNTIAQSNADLDTKLSEENLITLKRVFEGFIMNAEDYGYGCTLGSNGTFSLQNQNVLTKAGINSPAQQELLLMNLTVIDTQIIEKLNNYYAIAKNKESYLNELTTQNKSASFNALSNENKINFINNLPDLTQEQRDTYIANALQNVIDMATTPGALIALQKETFAQNDILLQALQDKIKSVLIDEYKYLPPLDQYNFKQTLLDPKDFTNYSRAFKTLSLSDQQAIADSLGIHDILLKPFQKAFLADKIFFAKTIDELNNLRADINAINNKTPNYFTSEDIAGKHSYNSIGDAIISKTQDILEQKIKSAAIASNSTFNNSKEYFISTLLNITSGDIYATTFRELPLTAQHELAQVFNIDEDTEFKEFQKKIFLDEVGVATTPTELALLQEVGNSIGIDQTTMDTLNKRLNKAIESGTVSEEIPSAHGIPLDPNVIVPNQEDPNSGTKTKENPSVEDIKTEFNDQNLSSNAFHNAALSEEEREKLEKEYQEQELARKTEEAAEQKKAKAEEEAQRAQIKDKAAHAGL